jgi:hypothetical protein
MNIRQFSNGELEKELERRKREKAMPLPIDNPDFGDLIGVCKQYIREIAEYGRADEDYDHYIYEAALAAIYGKDVWRFINGKFD